MEHPLLQLSKANFSGRIGWTPAYAKYIRDMLAVENELPIENDALRFVNNHLRFKLAQLENTEIIDIPKEDVKDITDWVNNEDLEGRKRDA